MMKKQRCIYLFVSLLALLLFLPLAEQLALRGALTIISLQWLVLFGAVTALNLNRTSLLVISGLAALTIALQLAGILYGNEQLMFLARICMVVFYLLTIVRLLRYVLYPDAIDADKLYGAAAVYLMLGVTWAYMYSLLATLQPEAFHGMEQTTSMNNLIDLVYFSFTTLTTTGFGDITPVTTLARMLAILEQITGTLFVAILIARLAGAYTPTEKNKKN